MFGMSEKEKIYDNANIIFENDLYMVVEPLTTESVSYFTDNNTTVVKSWESIYQGNGRLFLIIVKKYTPSDVYGIFVNDDGTTLYLSNEGYDNYSYDELIEEIPQKIIKIVEPYIYESNVYGLLMKMKSGSQIPRYELERVDSLFNKVKYNIKNPNKTIIRLRFDDSRDYFNVLNVPDDDRYILDDLFGYGAYYNVEVYNYDFASQDWDEGYMILSFNEENKDKLKDILRLISPNLSDWDGKEDKVASLLDDEFRNEVENIISTYQEWENECRSEELRNVILSDICNPFERYGLYESDCMSDYYTSLGLLLSMYEYVGDKSLTLREMLSKLIKDKSYEGYDEYRFDVYCNKEYPESFHNDIEYELEKIIDIIEDSDRFRDVEEYSKMYSYFGSKDSKYQFNKTYKTPKSMSVNFIPLKINPNNNKILIRVYDNNGESERELTMDEFNNFLYSGELF